MKKLMIALAAATTAMFSFGDFTSTGFEDGASSPYKAGELLSTTNDDAGNVAGAPGFVATWVALPAEEVVEHEIRAYGENDPAPEGGENQYLHVESSNTSTLLQRYVQQGGAAASIGDGIYLDTLVKFSPADKLFEASDITTGDKIAITYVGEDPTEVANPISNIVVCAGYVNGQEIVPTNYVMNLPDNADFDVNAWHRLTVRSIANVGSSVAPVGFAIYIDGELLDYDVDQHAGVSAYETDIAGNSTIATYLYNSTKHAFVPSLVSGEYNTATTLASVGFKGTGCIDNIAFSETKPAGLPDEGILITIDSDEGVSSVAVTVGETEIPGDNGVYRLPTGTLAFYLDVTWNNADGYTTGTIKDGDTPITTREVSVSGDMIITVKGIRDNFEFVDGNGDTVTASTLTDAFARVGDGETITLKFDYDVTSEGESTVYELSAKEVTLDLHGNTITGGANADDALFTVNSGAILTVVDSVGGGKIEDDTVYGIFLIDGDVIIGSADATDKGVTIDGILVNSEDSGSDITIKRGKFDATSNSQAGEFMWPVDGDSECSAEPDGDDYWVVTPKGGSAPTQVAVPTALLGIVYDGTLKTGVVEQTGFTLTGNTGTNAGSYEATATLAAGYIWSDNTTEAKVISWGINPDNNAEVVVTLTSEIAEYSAQLEFPTVHATIGNGVVEGTPTWDPATITEPEAGATNTYTVTFTVTTANYAGSTGTATFKVYKAAGGEYPTYIDEITDPTTKEAYETKYDTWKTTYEADATSTHEAAFLLNIAPDAADQTLEPASITMEGGKVVISANQTLTAVNGKVYVKVATTLAGLASAEWTEATLNEGKVQVTPGSSDTAGFYKIKVDF